MSLELSKSGMGPDISVKFGEFSPMGSMTSSEERKKKERIPRNTIVSWQRNCPDPKNGMYSTHIHSIYINIYKTHHCHQVMSQSIVHLSIDPNNNQYIDNHVIRVRGRPGTCLAPGQLSRNDLWL